MKKIFALLLVLFLMLPLIVACGDKENGEDSKPESSSESTTNSATSKDETTTDSSTTPGSTDESSTTPGSSTTETSSTTTNTTKPNPNPRPDDKEYIPSKDVILDTWSGKTLNILATRWNTAEPAAPWSVAELCATKKDDDTGYGRNINNSILERAEFIKNTYGVTLNWIQAPSGILSLLNVDATTPGSDYHIAMPRMYEAQSLVMGGVVLDMSESIYLDFGQSFFNQMAYESYTVAEHTFFAAGDFSFIDEQTSFVIFYSQTLASEYAAFPDVYDMVRYGDWTVDMMYMLAASVSENLDGKEAWTDEDKYGFGTTTLQMFFQYFGIQQVSVDPDTQQYYISLNDDKVGTAIDKIIYCMQATWARSNWGADNGRGSSPAFIENRLLFLNQALQTIDHFRGSVSKNFQFGLLPFPKLTEDDEYHTPVSYQSVVICIPKSAYWADGGKTMAEYFVDVLSWTGQEYMMAAYLGDVTMSLADEDSIEMLEEYIFPNMMYDQGYMYSWNGLLTANVQVESYKSGTNKFAENFARESVMAQSTINEWNNAWMYYDEDDYRP